MSHQSFRNFITKISQLICVYYKDKKQKQMQAQQQLLQNEELFQMSAQLLRQHLELDELQFQQLYHDEKLSAYIKCIQRIGLMLSKNYQVRESDLMDQISTLKQKNMAIEQKLSNYIDENLCLKDMIDHYENDRKQIHEKLNTSEHQLQRGKSYIIQEISMKQNLLKEIEKLKTTNQQLSAQNESLKRLLNQSQEKLSNSITQIKDLNTLIIKSKKDLQKTEQQCINLKQEKNFMQKQIQSMHILIQEKDFMIMATKPYKSGDQIQYSAEHPYPYFTNSIRIVREQNQDYGSDRDVMKECEYKAEIFQPEKLKFQSLGQSRSITQRSEKSQKSDTSLQIQHFDVELSNAQQIHEYPQTAQKVLQTQGKKQQLFQTAGKEEIKKKSNSKIPPNPPQKTVAKNLTPLLQEKSKSKQKSLTSKVKRQMGSSQKKPKIPYDYNSSAQNIVKSKKFRSNASVILDRSKTVDRQGQIENLVKNQKILHSQSVQDLYSNESQMFEKQKFQKELMTKEKLIQRLKFQNQSVKQMVFQVSSKRTQAQYQYEQNIEKLNSELQYCKQEIKKLYSQYIQQKALGRAYQEQLQKVADQHEKAKEYYDAAIIQIKDRCKRIIEQQIAHYKEEYEKVFSKMKQLQAQLANKQQSQKSQSQQSQNTRGRKCRSNSLFYKQVKHHSYNTSQQYSEINHISANHSKNTSVMNIGDDENDRTVQQSIKIVDYEDNNLQEEYPEMDEEQHEQLFSYKGDQIETKQQEVQTQAIDQQDSLKLSLQSSLRHVQSMQMAKDFSQIAMKSLDDSKIKIIQDKFSKIPKLHLHRLESIFIESQKYQKDQEHVSEFDTLQLQISSRVNQTQTIGIENTDEKQKSIVSDIISFYVTPKYKIDSEAQTFSDRNNSLCRHEFITIQKHLKPVSNVQSQTQERSFQNNEVQTQKKLLLHNQVQTLNQQALNVQNLNQTVEKIMLDNETQTIQKNLSINETQTVKKQLLLSKVCQETIDATILNTTDFGFSCDWPVYQQVSLQIQNQTSQYFCQTQKKQLSLINYFTSTCFPQVKQTVDFSVLANIHHTQHKDTQTQIHKTQKYTSTTKPIILSESVISETCFPTKKSTREISINSVSPILHEKEVQKSITWSEHYTQAKSFIQSISMFAQTQTETITKKQLQICEPVYNDTVYPYFQQRNYHNQSFNQEQINEVLMDLTQSYDISEGFIQSLKKKLLEVHYNLKQIQDDKPHDASSSDSGVQKVFKYIDVEEPHIKEMPIQTVPKFKASYFQGNVKTSKSTNCSLSTSFSCFSPLRHEEEIKQLKVTQFHEIQEIQTENVDSLTRIQAQINESMTYNHEYYEGSVNRSPQMEQHNFIHESLRISQFRLQESKKLDSAKKFIEVQENQSVLINSPRIHQLSIPEISLKKQQKKQLKKPIISQPQMLPEVSEIQFQEFCLKFRPKTMQLTFQLNGFQTHEIPNFSKVYKQISEKEVIILFCKNVKKNGFKYSDLNDIYDDVIVMNETKVVSLKQRYMFETRFRKTYKDPSMVVLGNEEIVLHGKNLHFRFKNKLNYFTGTFPFLMSYQEKSQIMNKTFTIQKLYKYKIK